MNIHESGEDYLEMILMLNRQLGTVRSVDVARELAVTKPSVSIALKKLREQQYLTVNENGMISLTETGAAVANRIYERHLLITQMLMNLGVSRELAQKDACKIEHDISDETFTCIKRHLEDHQKN